jgi:glutamate-1-semialdehyde 2,1-aminomutase
MAFGKIIGGGMPVGAYGASAEIMSNIAPDGPVYQAGTLSGNPVAMAAGLAQLKACAEPGFYEGLEAKTKKLVTAVQAHADAKNYIFRIFQIGSIFWVSFSKEKAIRRMDEIPENSGKLFAPFHRFLLERGVYLGPSGYEVGFVSAAHTDADIEKAIVDFNDALDHVFNS